jgi:hypothetical protein
MLIVVMLNVVAPSFVNKLKFRSGYLFRQPPLASFQGLYCSPFTSATQPYYGKLTCFTCQELGHICPSLI